MPYNLLCIIIAQAMLMMINIMFYSFTPIVGKHLFKQPELANLPIAISLLAMVSVTIPFGIWSQKYGRKTVFITGCIATLISGLLFFIGLERQNTSLFILGAICLGIGSAAMSFYRFAAMEVVSTNKQSFAISAIMLVGVFSALIAPNIAIKTRNLLPIEFSASFLFMLPLALIALLFIIQVKWPTIKVTQESTTIVKTDWNKLWLPIFIGSLSYFIMTVIMTATPLHMHNHHHPFSDTAFVIQWHMLGMFAPSLITGYLIKRFSLPWLSYVGILLLFTSLIINLFAQSTFLLAISLAILGIGWNFSFISASQLLVNLSTGQKKAKVQGINDFFVFGLAALGSLSSSWFIESFGWQKLNYGLISIITLTIFIYQFTKINNSNDTVK